MKKIKLRTPRLPEAKAAFSRCLKVAIENAAVVFVSGTASVAKDDTTAHPGDVYAQTMHTYKNIVSILEQSGARFKDIVKFTIYLKTMDDYNIFNKARDEFFQQAGLLRDEYPASTCVEARLCRDDLLVEIEAIALVSHR